MHNPLPVRTVILVAPVIGIAGGISGVSFARLMLASARSANPTLRVLKARPVTFAALCGLVVALCGIASGGASWGTGYGATRALVEGGSQALWFGPIKFLAALATAVSGAPDGIFAPSLAVGAGVGNLLAPLLPGTPVGAVVLLDMVAYFVGVVRAPLTAVIILIETTASRGMVFPLFATALLADTVAGLVCRERLYHGLARPFLARVEKEAAPSPVPEAKP